MKYHQCECGCWHNNHKELCTFCRKRTLKPFMRPKTLQDFEPFVGMFEVDEIKGS